MLGKGGVGKSTVAAALALAARESGASVLAIELNAPAGLSRALDVRLSAPGAIAIANSGVSVMFIDGAAALAEFMKRKLHLGSLTDAVLAHPLYKAFVAAAPGVKELLAIGKIQDEVRLRKRWDVVVVDAGGSGHAIELLRMPSAAEDTFRSGRVHREAKHVHAMLADTRHTAVHVVATAEEMPVAEAIDSVARIGTDLGLPIGRVIVNRCTEPAPEGVEQALAALVALPARSEAEARVREAMLMTVQRGIGWSRIQEDAIAHLATATARVPLRLPRLTGNPIGMRDLATLAHVLALEVVP